MKTRSQTKSEKLKIPRLNEDVFGIILKHVIQKQRLQVMISLRFIVNHFEDDLEDVYDYCTESDISPIEERLCYHDTNLRDVVQWPHQLKSNSQRLVYHTKIKLYSNLYFENDLPFPNLISSMEELDMLWETFKHFSNVFNYPDEIMGHGMMTPIEFIQKLRKHLKMRQARSRFLVGLLKGTKHV